MEVYLASEDVTENKAHKFVLSEESSMKMSDDIGETSWKINQLLMRTMKNEYLKKLRKIMLTRLM